MRKILISHRGNLTGKQPELENTPKYIDRAIAKGFYCEIDVHGKDGALYLGHDQGLILTDESFLRRPSIVAHAKNIDALATMLSKGIHCFYHHSDHYTLTSQNWIWAFPGKPAVAHGPCIAVLPENYATDVTLFSGVCSDFIEQFA